MGKTITVSETVYEQLKELKEQKDHTTYDSALREVMRDAGQDV